MTTDVAELCGHRWTTNEVDHAGHPYQPTHACRWSADHPPPCTCRCGATTTTAEGER